MGKAINIAGGTLTAKDHAVINHCLKDNSIGIGAGFGNEMAHRLDSVNEIAILDGFAMVQGRCYVIYPGDEEKLVIRSGSQGARRHDLVVLEFDNALEQMDLKVLEGEESSDPVDPEVIQDDTLGGGNLYQMPMYRILVDGLSVEIEDLREYMGSAVGKNVDLSVTTFNTPKVLFMVEDGDKENTIRFTNGVKLEGGGGGAPDWSSGTVVYTFANNGGQELTCWTADEDCWLHIFVTGWNGFRIFKFDGVTVKTGDAQSAMLPLKAGTVVSCTGNGGSITLTKYKVG